MELYKSVSGTAENELISIKDPSGKVGTIFVSNTHTLPFTVSVYFKDGSNNKTYIIKDINLPKASSWELSSPVLEFKPNEYALCIQLGAAQSGTSSVDVITKRSK